jgi:hypothetical protein
MAMLNYIFRPSILRALLLLLALAVVLIQLISYKPLKDASKPVLELIKEESPFANHFEIIANYSGRTEQWREESEIRKKRGKSEKRRIRERAI